MPVSIKGSGGGSVTLDAGAAAANSTLTLPNTSGTVLTTAAAITVAQGGTGATSLTANNVLLGNGTSAVQVVAPGTSGNVLTSNGTTWTSQTPSASSSPKGWVNFNGTAATISSSYNASSITKNGTGDYTINWTSFLGSSNYALTATCQVMGAEGRAAVDIGLTTGLTTTTSQVRCAGNSALRDSAIVCAIVFGT